MDQEFQEQKSYVKKIRNMGIVFGLFYILIGIVNVLTFGFEDTMYYNDYTIDNSVQKFIQFTDNVNELWSSFKPFVLGLGVLYLVFAFYIEKTRKHAIVMHMVLMGCSFVIATLYVIFSVAELLEFKNDLQSDIFFIINVFSYYIMYGLIGMVAAFTIPQIFIQKMLRKQMYIDLIPEEQSEINLEL